MLPAVDEKATVCGGDTGFQCPRLPIKIFLTVGLPDWDVGDFSNLVAAMKQQGYPVEFHQVREGHTWDNWRGLSDEMLTYFFSTE
jgi:enterochelin esterase-like enzyme